MTATTGHSLIKLGPYDLYFIQEGFEQKSIVLAICNACISLNVPVIICFGYSFGKKI